MIEDAEDIVGDVDLDLLGPSSSSEGFDTCIDDSQHVEFGDKIGDPPLRDDRTGELCCDVHVSRINLTGSEESLIILWTDDDALQDDLRLIGEGPDDLADSIEFDLLSCIIDMSGSDTGISVPLCDIGSDPEKIQGLPRISGILC